MSLVSISIQEKTKSDAQEIRFFSMGFRPFFVGGALVANFAVVYWVLLYMGVAPIPTLPVPAPFWHAHEMVYGFTAAIVAGFLLTAVPRWTNTNYLQGAKLIILSSLWALGRIGFFFGYGGLLTAVVADTLFYSILLAVLFAPIYKTKQWRHGAVIGKVLFLFIGSSMFYAGALGLIPNGYTLGIYLGFYVVVGLILTMIRRLLPVFIEGAAQESLALRRSAGIDRASLVLFLVFTCAAVCVPSYGWHQLIALPLFVLHSMRMLQWYHHSIWHHVLVWSLLVAYAFLTVGFLLLFLAYLGLITELLAIHTLAAGGMGFVILSMMCRVTLGHGGGQVFRPPPGTVLIFVALSCAWAARVALPLFLPQEYSLGLTLSGFLWGMTFLLYLWLYRLYLFPHLLNHAARYPEGHSGRSR